MKNKILYGVMVTLFCTFSASVNGQLKIAENGCVGIKCSSPMSNLSIGSNGISNAQLYLYSQAGSGTQYGIYSKLIYGTNSTWRTAVYGLSQALSGHIAGLKGEALSPNNSTSNFYAYGVYGLAGWSSNGRNYGVFGRLREGETAGAGIYGTNSDGLPSAISGKYAGYFVGNTNVNGNMYASSFNTTSDAKLKTNITDIQSDAISKVNNLRPIEFQWQQVDDIVIEDDSTTTKIPHFSSDVDLKQKHYGLLAQDVQKLFPELVHEDGAGYLSVNYMELIPLLIQAVQELSAEVDELKAKQ